MTNAPKKDTHTKARQIVGFSLDPEIARAVKERAAKEGLSLRKLFEQMWSSYTSKRPQAGS